MFGLKNLAGEPLQPGFVKFIPKENPEDCILSEFVISLFKELGRNGEDMTASEHQMVMATVAITSSILSAYRKRHPLDSIARPLTHLLDIQEFMGSHILWGRGLSNNKPSLETISSTRNSCAALWGTCFDILNGYPSIEFNKLEGMKEVPTESDRGVLAFSMLTITGCLDVMGHLYAELEYCRGNGLFDPEKQDEGVLPEVAEVIHGLDQVTRFVETLQEKILLSYDVVSTEGLTTDNDAAANSDEETGTVTAS